ncbi:unnamed protein product [Moneuplotes crassus]|uniref:Uncharacterized protein n=1 Tax=Euplotes crassus TaxID=5936 RepID=A0AAD2D9A4_EUPCR|nr:unnamed protein product [Moneuplotes crassus]
MKESKTNLKENSHRQADSQTFTFAQNPPIKRKNLEGRRTSYGNSWPIKEMHGKNWKNIDKKMLNILTIDSSQKQSPSQISCIGKINTIKKGSSVQNPIQINLDNVRGQPPFNKFNKLECAQPPIKHHKNQESLDSSKFSQEQLRNKESSFFNQSDSIQRTQKLESQLNLKKRDLKYQEKYSGDSSSPEYFKSKVMRSMEKSEHSHAGMSKLRKYTRNSEKDLNPSHKRSKDLRAIKKILGQSDEKSQKLDPSSCSKPKTDFQMSTGQMTVSENVVNMFVPCKIIKREDNTKCILPLQPARVFILPMEGGLTHNAQHNLSQMALNQNVEQMAGILSKSAVSSNFNQLSWAKKECLQSSLLLNFAQNYCCCLRDSKVSTSADLERSVDISKR